MAKTSWNDYSATPGSNTDIDGVNIDEGCAPSGINNAIREIMAHIADVVAGTTALSAINIDGGTIDGVTSLTVDASAAGAARASLGVAIGSDVQAYDADTLTADTADVLTAGFAAAPYNAGTQTSGTFTPNEANGNLQYVVNGGAHTLAPPTNNCTLVIQYTNSASAGAITTSGFTKVDGDVITTTNGDDFLMYITKLNGFSLLTAKALQ